MDRTPQGTGTFDRTDLDLPFDKRRNATGAHGPRVDFRLRDGWERTLDILIQKARERGIAWQTRGDLCREAVEWFVLALERKLFYDDEVISGFVEQMEIDDRIAWLRELKQRADSSVSTMAELLATLLTAGETVRAKNEYKQFMARVGRIRDALRRRYYSEAMEGTVLWLEVSKSLAPKEAADEKEKREKGDTGSV